LANKGRFLYAHPVKEASFFLTPLRESPGHRADFVERIPGVSLTTNKAETLARLQPHHDQAARRLGFSRTHLAGQVHGKEVAVVTPDSPRITPGVDALVTRDPLLLGIHVADCGALYLLDRVTGAIGLLHSGKKGTELNITAETIAAMHDHFGTRPTDLVAVLAPCIRPPHYEVDFAAKIKDQALAAGILPENYHDCGLCTASDLNRFYSYRREKGKTGRLLALLGRLPS
jgi:copper oxidase (laccase) domain-containing protein